MQLNKQLTATLSANALTTGIGTYEWSVEDCTCSCVACSCVTFSTVGVTPVTSTTVEVTVTYPDTCTEIIIKLTIINEIDGEECTSELFYEVINNDEGMEMTWSCTTQEEGCRQIASLNPIFATQEACEECDNCPCSIVSPCANAELFATYDCDTHILLIDTTNPGGWCDGVVVLNALDINQTITDNGEPAVYAYHQDFVSPDNICGATAPCAPAFPISIDLTSNPFPNGIYSVEIALTLNDCTAMVSDLWITCSTGATNLACCVDGSADASEYDEQGNPPKVYTMQLDDPSTTTLTVDFFTFVQADKLSIFTSWDPGTLTGTEVATTGYIGQCSNVCNTYLISALTPVYQGYSEKVYTTATPVTNTPINCVTGAGSSNTIVPNDFQLPAGVSNPIGAARLVLNPAYFDTLTLTNSTIYIVVYNNASVLDECKTIWQFKAYCGSTCPCNEPTPPVVTITNNICYGPANQLIQAGNIEYTTDCANGTFREWSINGGVDWYSTPLSYNTLPDGSGTLQVRCSSSTATACVSDPAINSYIKSDCCWPEFTTTVECNEYEDMPQSQYTYDINIFVEDCTPYTLVPALANNTNEITATAIGDDLDIHIYCNAPFGQTTDPYYYSYTLNCLSCGVTTTWFIRPNGTVVNNAQELICTPSITRCCREMVVTTPNTVGRTGEVTLTINGDTHVYNFSCLDCSTNNATLQTKITNINSFLAPYNVVLTSHPNDFYTWLAYSDGGCEGWKEYYTIITVDYNCEDDISLLIAFTPDYSTKFDSATDKLQLTENLENCVIDALECGFCKLFLGLRGGNFVVTDNEYIFLELDTLSGATSIGSAYGESPYTLQIMDLVNNVSVPNTVIEVTWDANCVIDGGDIVMTPTVPFNTYENLVYDDCYYIRPTSGTIGIYEITVTDSRNCSKILSLCVQDLEITATIVGPNTVLSIAAGIFTISDYFWDSSAITLVGSPTASTTSFTTVGSAGEVSCTIMLDCGSTVLHITI